MSVCTHAHILISLPPPIIPQCAWLPLRDRLRCQSMVCKTWTHWLEEQTDLYKNLKLHIGRYSRDNMWLTSDALLRIIVMAPPGSIESLDLTADCKTGEIFELV